MVERVETRTHIKVHCILSTPHEAAPSGSSSSRGLSTSENGGGAIYKCITRKHGADCVGRRKSTFSRSAASETLAAEISEITVYSDMVEHPL